MRNFEQPRTVITDGQENDSLGGGHNKPELSPEELAKERLILLFKRRSINSAQELIKSLSLPPEILHSPEVLEAAREGLIPLLKRGHLYDARKLINACSLPPEILYSSEVLEAAKEGLIFLLKYVGIDDAQELIKSLSFPPEIFHSPEILEAAKEGLISLLKRGRVNSAQRLSNTFSLPPEIFHSPEILEAAKEGLISLLKEVRVDRAQELSNFLSLPPEILHSPEALEAAKERLISLLKGEHFIYHAQKLINFLSLPPEILHSPEVLKAAKERLIFLLKRGRVDRAQELSNFLSLPLEILHSPEVLEAAKERSVSLLKEGIVDRAQELSNFLSLPPEILHSPEILEAAKKGLVSLLKNRSVDIAQQLIKSLSLPPEILHSPEILEAAKEGLISLLKEGDIDRAQKLINAYSLSPEILHSPEALEAAKKGLISLLKEGDIDRAQKLINAYSLSPEILHSPEILEAVRERFTFLLKGGSSRERLHELSFLNTTFRLEEESRIEQYIQSKGLTLTYEDAQHILAHDRFGKNLFRQYFTFDKVATEGVNLIVNADKNLDPTLDRRGIEYRLRIQEELENYKNNAQTRKRLEERGVSVDAWLTHNAVTYFELGEAEKLSFGQKIHLPVSRFQESFAHYDNVMRAVVLAYKDEVLTARIPTGTEETQQELEKMRSALATLTDDKKRKGLENAIRKAEESLQNPKTISVWDKLHRSFSRLTKLAEEVRVHNDKLIALENEEIVITDDESQQRSLDRKKELWILRKKIIEDLTALNLRRLQLTELLTHTLTPVIGKDRTEGVIQEFHAQTAELTDHLESDFASTTVFIEETKEKEETDPTAQFVDAEVLNDDSYLYSPKHAGMLEGRPMSVRLGSRSRQDLYIGNYTTCCIRIDSDYHQAESPIVDYVTDLGMHNLLIYDETTKTPVACAFLWIGEDKSGNTALVIDNVEGWQMYTVSFKKQLEAQMLAYINDLARHCGLTTISQGPDYNDLDVLPREKQEEIYIKIGTNREDGYYLEAEYDDEEDDEAEYDDEEDDEVEYDDEEDKWEWVEETMGKKDHLRGYTL